MARCWGAYLSNMDRRGLEIRNGRLVEQLGQQVQALREQQASGRKREAHKLEAAETNLVRARWLGAAKLAAVVLVIAAQITMTRQQGASNSLRDIDSSKSPGKTQRSGQN